MADHQSEDTWASVNAGDVFPSGGVRAMNRGLQCKEHGGVCDAFVALWIRDDGEPVFGSAWNEDGKVMARFPWGGMMFCADDTNGFRILTYSEEHSKFKYKWVRASNVDTKTLLMVGDYAPAVVTSEEGETLGKANLARQMAWTCSKEKEVFHKGDDFAKAYLLCREFSGDGE